MVVLSESEGPKRPHFCNGPSIYQASVTKTGRYSKRKALILLLAPQDVPRQLRRLRRLRRGVAGRL